MNDSIYFDDPIDCQDISDTTEDFFFEERGANLISVDYNLNSPLTKDEVDA